MMSVSAKIFFFLSSLVIIGYLLSVGQSIIIPFIIALFFWYLINALSCKIAELTCLPSRISTSISILLIIGFLYLFGSVTEDNIQSFIAQLPDYQENVESLLSHHVDALGMLETEAIKNTIKDIELGKLAGGIALALGNVATMTVTILLYLVFLFLEQATFSWKLKALFPKEKKHKKISELLSKIGGSIEAYVGLKTLASVVMGVLGFTVLAILGVDNAVFWALIFGVLNFIPYIGPVIGVVFPVLAAFVQFGHFNEAIIIAVALTVIAFVIGNIIEPKLFGRSLNLSPLVIMISLSIWGSLWGVIGMILSIPLMVMVMLTLYHFEATKPYALLMSEKEPNQ